MKEAGNMTAAHTRAKSYDCGREINALILSFILLIVFTGTTSGAPLNNTTALSLSSDQIAGLIYDEQELGLLRQAYEMAAPLQVQGFLNQDKFAVIEMRLNMAISKHNILVAQLFKGNETRIKEMSLDLDIELA
jgi:hypothetical protein